MGHMVGTADGAYGRDDGWGASTGSCILGKVWTDVLSEFTNTTTVTPESAKRATVIPENAKRLSGTFLIAVDWHPNGATHLRANGAT